MDFTKLIQKITAFFASVILLFSTCICGEVYPPDEAADNTYFTPEGQTMTLIENGSSEYKIVRGENASPSEVTAANKLAGYLEQISGYEMAVVTDATQKSGKEIIVGKTNREGERYRIRPNDLGTDGYYIVTVGSDLVIAGGEQRGTLYGVYAFLEYYLNCRWFTKDLIKVPQSSTVVIPASINLVEKPYLEYRETDWISPRDIEYSIANRQNGNIYRYLSPENGGNFGYAGNRFAHTLTTSIVAANTYFADHPEYYAMGTDGCRTSDQLCLTNPDTLQVAISEVLALIRSHPNAQIVSVTQHDNQNYCQCEKCKAIDKEEGAHSGTLLRFVNAIADAVKAEGYDNVKIDTFAYQYTRSAPKKTVPRDNVIIRFCTIECCFSHPIAECSEAADMRQDLADWKAICKTLYVWDYTTNYANFLGPFPDFGVIQQNLQYFVENNVVGVYEEGNYQAAESNGEFAELRAYLLSKLLWNPYIDMDKAMNEFLEAYYGAGWKSIRKYIDMTTANTGRTTFLGQQHMHIFTQMSSDSVLYLNRNQIDYCNSLWADAFDKASTADEITHLRLSEISWRYWKACKKIQEFSRFQHPDKWQASNEQLYNDMVELGISRIREGGNGKLTDTPDFTKTPNTWYKKVT